MIALQKCIKLLSDGFSLITVGDDKVPNYSWASSQEKKLSEKEFKKRYQYKGGYIKKDGREMKATQNIGIVTGYDYLECIDVDLKVFSTAQEQRQFWNEFISMLEDNIFDFKDKFVIAKTKNAGFHIIYKSKRVTGNKKIATLKGHTEAIIESRGKGGYIFAYENFLNDKSYRDIQFITDKDREILWYAAKIYNYVEPEKEKESPSQNKKYISKEGDITPWDDFNQKNNVWDIVSEDFKIVRDTKSHTIIKRHESESAHSGYIFKDNDLMYLFSTGTIYEHEKPYTAWGAYVKKNFNDDFSAAAKKAYSDGYGTRILRIEDAPPKPEKELNLSKLDFPIDIFPESVQSYLMDAEETLGNSIDYMGCALIWALSVSIGNAVKIEIVPGWTETSTIWISIVGKPGWGKTPSIKRIIKPLEKSNSRVIKKYYKELEKFEHYDSLTKKEKQEYPEVNKPSKNQFIANDITLEALVDLHGESKNSVGVFKDELAGWFKDMNKYRDGSDKEFWLSCWSGSPVVLTRVTRKGSYIEKPCIPVLGGIQPSVLEEFNTSENKENGFMDRMLLSYPELKSNYLSRKRISYTHIKWFNDLIVGFFDLIKENVLKLDEEGEISPLKAVFSDEAYDIYEKRHTEITDIENDDSENAYFKSMLPKQKAYIARFALLIHLFEDYINGTENGALLINPESTKKAIKLSNYFIEMAKKVKINSNKSNDIKKIINANKNKTSKNQVKEIWKINPDFDKNEVAEIIGVSIRTIQRYVSGFDK